LQSQLLRRLKDAASAAAWIARAPEGLDLEYCLHSDALREQLLGLGKDKVLLILRDDRTRVASEGTCLALALLCIQHEAIPEADRHELLAAVRWQWLPPSSVCYVAELGVLSAAMVSVLHKVTRFEGFGGALLGSMCEVGDVMHLSALRQRRPASRMAELELPWEVSVEALREIFGTDNLIALPGSQLFCGFHWGVNLRWSRGVEDTTLGKLCLMLEVNTEGGAVPPLGCVVSGVFDVITKGRCVVRGRAECWRPDSVLGMVSSDLLEQGVRVWPVGGGAPFEAEDGALRGTLVVKAVM
jgi:hypothetical protein